MIQPCTCLESQTLNTSCNYSPAYPVGVRRVYRLTRCILLVALLEA